jgi:uncharacterized protein
MNGEGLLLRETGAGCVIPVKVVPKASKNQIVGVEKGSLKIRVQAPPVDGAANDAVVRTLGDWLDVPRNAVVVQGGHRSRQKTIFVKGLNGARILEKLLGHR